MSQSPVDQSMLQKPFQTYFISIALMSTNVREQKADAFPYSL